MSRRRALIATGIGSLVIGIVLLAVDPQARDSSYPSIIEFEFAPLAAVIAYLLVGLALSLRSRSGGHVSWAATRLASLRLKVGWA
jgi:ABC-type sulfate transport system permease component